MNDTFAEKKQDEVINTSTTNTPSGSGGGTSSGAPGGQKGNQKGGAQSAGMRPALGFAAYGLGPLPSGMPPLNETRFRNDEVVFQIGGKLTNDDLNVIEGKRTELAGRLQQRYGYAKDEAEREIDTWLRDTT